MKTRAIVFATLVLAARTEGADAAPYPEVFISLRGVLDGVLEIGEPLFVGARLEAPFESRKPMTLAPASGTWADAVEIVLVRGETAPPLRATATFKPAAAAVTLDAEHAASGEWFFSAEQTARLQAGEYEVQARLAFPPGRAESEPTRLRVVARSDAPARTLQRTLALANEALLAGQLPEGVRLVDTLLTDQPDNLRLLALRARLCAAAGDLQGALICVTRALSTPQVESLGHPPIGLTEMREEIGIALLAPGASTLSPPAWTRLPPRVREVIRTAKTAAPPKPSAESGSPAPRPPLTTTAAPAGNPPPAPTAATTPAPSPAPAPVPAGPPPGRLVPVGELNEGKILADAAGQWAASAAAGSAYSGPNYSALRASGAPNVASAGDSVEAWCPGRQNDGTEWLELTYAKPVRAVEVRVRQTNLPGGIAKVEATAADGSTQVWWEGNDSAGLAAAGIAWFAVRVPATTQPIVKIKLTLDLARRPGWKQIDAVQLVAAP